MVIGTVFTADPHIHKKDCVKIGIPKTALITHEPTLLHYSFVVPILKCTDLKARKIK
jgi:hypothetical protein